MKKGLNYAVAGGSAIVVVTGAIATVQAIKGKNAWGIATSALGVLIGVAAFKYSLEKINNFGTTADV